MKNWVAAGTLLWVFTETLTPAHANQANGANRIVIDELRKLKSSLPVNDPSRKEITLRLADRLADEALILKDSINNPTDNYVDVINNQIGQKLGNTLKVKYGLNNKNKCTPALLNAYLNDLQSYYMRALELGMDNFRPNDEVVKRFSNKINTLLKFK